MFDSGDEKIPDACDIYIINIGELGTLTDVFGTMPQKSLDDIRSTQEAVETEIGKDARQRHGNSPASTTKLDRLKFQTMQEYASRLKGLEEKFISREGWRVLEEALRKDAERKALLDAAGQISGGLTAS